MNINLLHGRLGHLNYRDVKRYAKQAGISLQGKQQEICPSCIIGKITRPPVSKAKLYRSIIPYLRVHSDLMFAGVPSIFGQNVASVSFIDDFSRTCHRYFIKHKSEVANKFDSFLRTVVMGKGFRVSIIICDRGGEYFGQMQNFCHLNGIELKRCPTERHELNGVAERCNRTHASRARAMLTHACRPASYWEFALATATLLHYISPSKSNAKHKSPSEILEGKKSSLSSFLKVWGSPAYVLDHQAKGKFTPRAKVGIFVGYSDDGTGYQIYYPQTRVLLRGVINVVIDEAFAAPGIVPPDSIQFGSNYEHLFLTDRNSHNSLSQTTNSISSIQTTPISDSSVPITVHLP